MKARITIDQKFLDTCGSRTLMGNPKIVQAFTTLEEIEVELYFPQTSIGWRRRHGGPEIYVMPEFAIPLLLCDILKLQQMGVKVSIVMEEVRRRRDEG